MNYYLCREAEDTLLKVREMLSKGNSEENIINTFSKEKTRILANFLSIKGRSKKSKEELWNELFSEIKQYGETKQVYFIEAIDENREITYRTSRAINRFVFNVLFDSVLYRVVFKDGYPQALERLFQKKGVDFAGIEMPNDEDSDEICELVEEWFDQVPNKAHWREEEKLKMVSKKPIVGFR